ncbi:hypothetical protein RB195_014091 [Necator americanus]|uniref:Uncharacterized protein n=1 Tax=Necator americanus TaxID=51031 RepID=A0ABR1DYK2_NECAM
MSTPPPSKVATENRLRFFGHILRKPADCLVQRVLRSLSGLGWKRPLGRKWKFRTERVEREPEDTRRVHFRRDIRFRSTWYNRECWAELCSRTAHLGEVAGNRGRR